MKKDIIDQLKNAISYTDEEFKQKFHSQAFLIGYLQGTIKGVIRILEQEGIEVKVKK
jgi:hypothetical protein